MTETDRLKMAFEIALRIAAPESGQFNPIQGSFKEKFVFHFNTAYDAVKDCEAKRFSNPASALDAPSKNA